MALLLSGTVIEDAASCEFGKLGIVQSAPPLLAFWKCRSGRRQVIEAPSTLAGTTPLADARFYIKKECHPEPYGDWPFPQSLPTVYLIITENRKSQGLFL
jgi:hypothetical protein